MNKYESIIIAKANLTKEEIDEEIKKYEDYFNEISDDKVEAENLGVKKLAYEIKDNKEGIYVLFKFTGESENITELEKQYRLDDNIIKFITITVEREYEEESIDDDYIEEDELEEDNSYNEYNKELKDKVMQKVNKEYDEFIIKLKKQTPDEIIDKSYEKVCKEEIIDILDDFYFDNDKCNALLKCKNVLNNCYDEWLKTDGSLRGMLDYAVDKSVENIEHDFKIKQQKDINPR